MHGAKLRAGAVRCFLPASAHAYTNRITPLASIFDDADALETRVHQADDDASAFAALCAWLRRHHVLAHAAPSSLAVALVDRLRADSAIRRVGDLVRVAGLSTRPLQRLFRDHVGAAPKWVIRRLRLQEVAARLDRGDTNSLADLAVELGYTDHAHLTRDLTSVVGRAPSALRPT